MNQIKDPANEYDAGLEFNYAAWTADTTITLTNVPWNNDYRDIVPFESTNALNAYINQRVISNIRLDKLSYTKVNQPIRVDVPFNRINRFNYLRASNPIQPISGDMQKDYYYFITDVRYIAPNTTEIVVQLDVWQSFGREASFGNCYIERGHIGIANAKAFQNFGRDYLSIPEGFDIGAEYQIAATATETVMGVQSVGYNILVASTVDLNANPGVITAPVLVSAAGSSFQGMPSGASYYLFADANSFMSFMANMQDSPWVTQGIISITAIPNVTRFGYGPVAASGIPQDVPPNAPQRVKRSLFNKWRDTIRTVFDERYRHLDKFLTAPYTMVEITTFTGTPIMLRPEAWNDENGTYVERVSLLPPNQRVTFTPWKYNARPGAGGTENAYGPLEDNGENQDLFTQVANFPAMAIVNNGAISFMAANTNSLAFQNSAADWSQTRALASNEVQYDQSTMGMNVANSLTEIGRSADAQQTALNNQVAWMQTGVGAAGSLLGGVSGGVAGVAGAAGGAALSGISTAISTDAATRANAIRNMQANASNNANVTGAGYVRDTNKDLADWAARGDYSQAIGAINAKVRDAQLTQPSTSGQLGGEALNMINDGIRISMRIKTLDPSAMRVIGEYWLRYGYAVRQPLKMPASLHCMTKFTYWKLTETYLLSAGMPETMKQAIRGIFEKGVTVWRDPDDIGNIDYADNEPLEGITL